METIEDVSKKILDFLNGYEKFKNFDSPFKKDGEKLKEDITKFINENFSDTLDFLGIFPYDMNYGLSIHIIINLLDENDIMKHTIFVVSIREDGIKSKLDFSITL